MVLNPSMGSNDSRDVVGQVQPVGQFDGPNNVVVQGPILIDEHIQDADQHMPQQEQLVVQPEHPVAMEEPLHDQEMVLHADDLANEKNNLAIVPYNPIVMQPPLHVGLVRIVMGSTLPPEFIRRRSFESLIPTFLTAHIPRNLPPPDRFCMDKRTWCGF